MSEHTAILVPADLSEDHQMITWTNDALGSRLLPVLYRAMRAEPGGLSAATVGAPGDAIPGGLRLWSLDTSLLAPDPAYNDRAIAVCRHFGYPVSALAGPIVFIGAPDGEDEAGLTPAMARWLDLGLTSATAAARKMAAAGGST